MPREKRRGRHGAASKKSPRKKKLSSQADIKEASNDSQRQSNSQIALNPPQQSSSAISANWKDLAKVGLYGSNFHVSVTGFGFRGPVNIFASRSSILIRQGEQ